MRVAASGRITRRTIGPAVSGERVSEATEYITPKTKCAMARARTMVMVLPRVGLSGVSGVHRQCG